MSPVGRFIKRLAFQVSFFSFQWSPKWAYIQNRHLFTSLAYSSGVCLCLEVCVPRRFTLSSTFIPHGFHRGVLFPTSCFSSASWTCFHYYEILCLVTTTLLAFLTLLFVFIFSLSILYVLYYGTGERSQFYSGCFLSYCLFSIFGLLGLGHIYGPWLFGGGGLRAFGEMSVCKLLATFTARGEAG